MRLGLTVPDYVLANTCAKGPFQSGSLELRSTGVVLASWRKLDLPWLRGQRPHERCFAKPELST